jgi:trans-aconitate methyltransferase
MPLLDNLIIEAFHKAKNGKYGPGNAKSLGWFTEESQLKRFEVLSRAGNLDHASVLDVGCGNGDLGVYLSQRFKDVHYQGIDLMKDYLEIATERNQHNPQARFYLGDFMSGALPKVDYVFACGSLNYKNSDPAFIQKVITQLYTACTKALAFNLLSQTPNPNGILVTYKPSEIVEFCRTLSPHVTLIDDYEEGDFTVVLRKLA